MTILSRQCAYVLGVCVCVCTSSLQIILPVILCIQNIQMLYIEERKRIRNETKRLGEMMLSSSFYSLVLEIIISGLGYSHARMRPIFVHHPI